MAVHYESRGRRFICPAGRSPGTPPPDQTAALFTERRQMSTPPAPNVIEFAHPLGILSKRTSSKSFNQSFASCKLWTFFEDIDRRKIYFYSLWKLDKKFSILIFCIRRNQICRYVCGFPNCFFFIFFFSKSICILEVPKRFFIPQKKNF